MRQREAEALIKSAPTLPLRLSAGRSLRRVLMFFQHRSEMQKPEVGGKRTETQRKHINKQEKSRFSHES